MSLAIDVKVQRAIHSALDYAFAVIEFGEHRVPTLPMEALHHARCCARHSIPLERVLARYLAGYTLFWRLVIKASAELGKGSQLLEVHDSLAVAFESLTHVISTEYKKEAAHLVRTDGELRLRRVKDLLAGKLMSAPDLSYDLDRNHLALIALGHGIETFTQGLAERLGGQVLVVQDSRAAWIWIATHRPLKSRDVLNMIVSEDSSIARVSIGESAPNVLGWRRSHRQALTAYEFYPKPEPWVIRYADVALLASIAKDDLLKASLADIYLAPLEEERDGGRAFRETLLAYFAAAGNASATASALGVNRATVRMRIASIEERLECSLTSVAPELATALRLDALTSG